MFRRRNNGALQRPNGQQAAKPPPLLVRVQEDISPTVLVGGWLWPPGRPYLAPLLLLLGLSGCQPGNHSQGLGESLAPSLLGRNRQGMSGPRLTHSLSPPPPQSKLGSVSLRSISHSSSSADVGANDFHGNYAFEGIGDEDL